MINNEKRESAMKKTVTGVITGFMLLASSALSANAATPYVSGTAALSVLDDSERTFRSYDTGYAIAGAVGLDNGLYRLEAELGYQKNGINHTNRGVSMTTYMGNGAIDIGLPVASLKPFITAGAGLADVEEEQVYGSNVGDTVFAWQIGAGAGFGVASNVGVDVQYRYFATSDPELAGQKKYTIHTHNVMVGLRVGF
jgi:opacity protein-like surface antigen